MALLHSLTRFVNIDGLILLEGQSRVLPLALVDVDAVRGWAQRRQQRHRRGRRREVRNQSRLPPRLHFGSFLNALKRIMGRGGERE